MILVVDIVFEILRGIVLGQFFLRTRALCFSGGSRTMVLSSFRFVGVDVIVPVGVDANVGIIAIVIVAIFRCRSCRL